MAANLNPGADRRARQIAAPGLVVMTAVAVCVANSGVARADNYSAGDNVTASETLNALQDVPGILRASDSVAMTSDGDTAASSSVRGVVAVDIPRDAEDGVSLTQPDGTSLTITPPEQGEAPGVAIAPGVVAYPGTNGSSTAVQATENGGLRFLTIIDDAEARQDYTYGVSVPAGGSIVVNDDGTASLLDGTGTVVSAVQAPWAKDANGVAVPTQYITDGHTLTQRVEHRAGSYAYPITADPWFRSYISCVLGIGVPAGLAWFFASTIGTVTAFNALRAQQLYVPQGSAFYSALLWYAGRVFNSCRSFIRS